MESQKRGKDVKCQNCGKVFYKKRSRIRKIKYNHFCCQECHSIYNKGKEIPWLGEIRKRGVCNNTGRTHFKKGNKGEKCVNWVGDNAKKKTGNKRAWTKFKSEPCEECGSEEKICRHHIDENTLNNNRKNIQFLCRSCHTKLHMKNMADETKKKISDTMKGRKLSIKHRENIRLGFLKRWSNRH